MNVYEANQWIENYYRNMRLCSSSSGRKYNANKILEIMRECPEVSTYWTYHPNEFYIENRFIRRPKQILTETKITIINHIAYDTSTQERHAPMEEGVYFIGSTSFNPYSGEKFYWVKIGMTQNSIKERLRQYDTHSPCIYHIDYLPCCDPIETESKYQKKLRKISGARSDRSTEWWMVDEATYLKMSKLGFRYFDTV